MVCGSCSQHFLEHLHYRMLVYIDVF
ncbi:hypothetical protein MARHY1868 [Marinobacter nauticus ATCC 49840]|nr:hypothetical protein MARHY1868 [Marinobacter nauticus ATCC 49840]